MMDKSTITLRVKVAWWVRPYIAGVEFFALTFGTAPDFSKVLATVLKGIQVTRHL